MLTREKFQWLRIALQVSCKRPKSLEIVGLNYDSENSKKKKKDKKQSHTKRNSDSLDEENVNETQTDSLSELIEVMNVFEPLPRKRMRLNTLVPKAQVEASKSTNNFEPSAETSNPSGVLVTSRKRRSSFVSNNVNQDGHLRMESGHNFKRARSGDNPSYIRLQSPPNSMFSYQSDEELFSESSDDSDHELF